TWLDNYGATAGSPLSAGELDFSERDFQLNNTRIETNSTQYEIPLTYANGFLLYRVRAVGVFLEDIAAPYYTTWSNSSTEKLSVLNWDHVEIFAHEANKNWQFQVSFAEEGKKKEVISYFDGTLRNRQTVTKINSDNNAIVGEVIYDNQGRPAVEVLPVPTSDDNIKYYPAFNKNDASSPTPFTHKDFDWDDPSAEDCEISLNKMTDGASLYYGEGSLGFPEFYQNNVPNAQGFPYSQIEYTADNTGRIKRKGGIGETHQLGSDNEMKYLYGTPTQPELNRLFGYRVGNALHYKKNVVIDPNGQVSTSFLDPQGRTIATALSGDNPQSPDEDILIGLADEEDASLHENVSIDVLDKLYELDPDTALDRNDLYATGRFGLLQDALQVSNEFLVTKPSTEYSFDYQFTSGSFTPEFCTTSYPFVYDLSISLKDECDVEYYLEGPGLVSGSYTYPTFSFIPKVGSYTLYKNLQINESSFENATNQYLASLTDESSACYIDPSAFSPDTSIEDCFETCTECEDTLGPISTYVLTQLQQTYGNTTFNEASGAQSQTLEGLTVYWNDVDDDNNLAAIIDSAEVLLYLGTYTREWELIRAECLLLPPCEDTFTLYPDPYQLSSCDISNVMLLADMKPGGQYGNIVLEEVENEAGEVELAILDELSVFNDDNLLLYTYPPFPTISSGNNWRAPRNVDGSSSHYKNGLGAISEIVVTATTLEDGSTEYFPEILGTPSTGTTSTGASYLWVYPENLKNITDFLSYWEDSWAEALLVYHPEHCYLKYSELLCDLVSDVEIYNPSIPGFETMEIGSQTFDSYLNLLDTYDSAVEAGYLNDSGLSSASVLINADPYFVNDLVGYDDVTSISNDKHKQLMQQAHSLYDESDMTMFQYAINVAVCDGLTACDTVAFSSLTAAQKTIAWKAYVSFYQSMKQRIQHVFLNTYAYNSGCYNGCIGAGDDYELSPITDPIRYYNRSDIDGYISSSTADQICDGDLAILYKDKTQRFVPIDVFYDSGASYDDVVDDLSSDAGYGSYVGTGICPLATHLETFLNGLVTQTSDLGLFIDIVNPTTPRPYNAGGFFMPDLYEAFGGVIGATEELSFNSVPTGSSLVFTVNGLATPCTNPLTLIY
ncbi:MAG: hypothetical protein HRT68_13975, partial [Flavobacteriaceae bacterium]|nr:hypothetical protein [Flavobacteriaceae bacterium]